MWTVALVELVLACAVMVVIWWIAVRIDNYGIVDIAWSYSFLLLALVATTIGPGLLLRRRIMLFMVGAWSLRLGTFLYRRVVGHHPTEDGRYRALREEYGAHQVSRFFWFFQMQGVSVALLSLPFVFACANAEPAIQPVEWVGLAWWALSLGGEALADHQMKRFKQDPANRGKTCEVGLWRYSRHPNYFFESMIWWGYYLFALASPGGWTTIYCPLGMLFLLTRVTGVPLAEKQALRSRGDEYRAYQKRVSAFVPWFRK